MLTRAFGPNINVDDLVRRFLLHSVPTKIVVWRTQRTFRNCTWSGRKNYFCFHPTYPWPCVSVSVAVSLPSSSLSPSALFCLSLLPPLLLSLPSVSLTCIFSWCCLCVVDMRTSTQLSFHSLELYAPVKTRTATTHDLYWPKNPHQATFWMTNKSLVTWDTWKQKEIGRTRGNLTRFQIKFDRVWWKDSVYFTTPLLSDHLFIISSNREEKAPCLQIERSDLSDTSRTRQSALCFRSFLSRFGQGRAMCNLNFTISRIRANKREVESNKRDVHWKLNLVIWNTMLLSITSSDYIEICLVSWRNVKRFSQNCTNNYLIMKGWWLRNWCSANLTQLPSFGKDKQFLLTLLQHSQSAWCLSCQPCWRNNVNRCTKKSPLIQREKSSKCHRTQINLLVRVLAHKTLRTRSFPSFCLQTRRVPFTNQFLTQERGHHDIKNMYHFGN